jgi:hypothetical protein
VPSVKLSNLDSCQALVAELLMASQPPVDDPLAHSTGKLLIPVHVAIAVAAVCPRASDQQSDVARFHSPFFRIARLLFII